LGKLHSGGHLVTITYYKNTSKAVYKKDINS